MGNTVVQDHEPQVTNSMRCGCGGGVCRSFDFMGSSMVNIHQAATFCDADFGLRIASLYVFLEF